MPACRKIRHNPIKVRILLFHILHRKGPIRHDLCSIRQLTRVRDWIFCFNIFQPILIDLTEQKGHGKVQVQTEITYSWLTCRMRMWLPLNS